MFFSCQCAIFSSSVGFNKWLKIQKHVFLFSAHSFKIRFLMSVLCMFCMTCFSAACFNKYLTI